MQTAAAAEPRAANLIDPQVETAFSYHAPKTSQPERYELLRGEAKRLAYLFLASCPPSRERSLAMTNLEQAIMWANASIARNE
jgi:hypothetical protein